MSPLVYVLISTTFGVAGQLTLKLGMNRIADQARDHLLLRIAFSPLVIGGLAGYGFGVIFWLLALSRLDVSYLYPFASLSYIGVMLGSYFLFHERITLLRIVGIAVIITGVVIIGMGG